MRGSGELRAAPPQARLTGLPTSEGGEVSIDLVKAAAAKLQAQARGRRDSSCPFPPSKRFVTAAAGVTPPARPRRVQSRASSRSS